MFTLHIITIAKYYKRFQDFSTMKDTDINICQRLLVFCAKELSTTFHPVSIYETFIEIYKSMSDFRKVRLDIRLSSIINFSVTYWKEDCIPSKIFLNLLIIFVIFFELTKPSGVTYWKEECLTSKIRTDTNCTQNHLVLRVFPKVLYVRPMEKFKSP